jgi:hypothetical protein
MRLANEQDQAIIRSAIADSSASTLSFLSSMGQREAIAFGEGVATTMRLKFEKLGPELIPGSATKHVSDGAAEDRDVDLVAVVDRLRNVPKASPAASFGDPISPLHQAGEPAAPLRQAGEPDFRRSATAQRADDDLDFGYGLKPTTFGMRPQRD